MSYCCIIMTLLLPMLPLTGVKHDMNTDLDFDFCKGGQSDGTYPNIIVYMAPTLWKLFMLKKDPNLKSFRWFPLLQDFEFQVSDKG